MKMDKQTAGQLQGVVMAASKILYAPQTREMLKQALKADIPMPMKLASQVVGVMKMTEMRSPNKKLPPKVLAPASIAMLMDLAQFMHRLGLKVSEDDIKQAMPLLKQFLVKVFGKQPQQAAPAQQPAQPTGMIGAAA